MAIEKEYIGELDFNTYTTHIKNLTSEFGQPKFKKRLGLMIFNRDNPTIDTRVRITNGDAEVMQKVTFKTDGKGNNLRREISISLSNDVEVIYNTYLTYSNLLPKNDAILRLMVQTENSIWEIQGFEVKLSHQFGYNDYYTFEVEELEGGDNPASLKLRRTGGMDKNVDDDYPNRLRDSDIDIRGIMKKLNLKSTGNHASEESKKYRSTQLDLHIEEMSKEEILHLIKKYL